jgi:hypothetical protein
MEKWRRTWRQGVGPALLLPGLEALRAALLTDDPRLIQGHTVEPPCTPTVQDWPVEKACAIGFCGWQGLGLETVGEVDHYFAMMASIIDKRMGSASACRHFFEWFDETPREVMRCELLPEVNRSIALLNQDQDDDDVLVRIVE